MTKPWRLAILLLPLLAFIVLVGFLLRGLFSDPTELSSALVGKPVPQFSVPDLYDPEQRYTQQVLSGKPMLLNVWATWCPTCRAEHAYLNQLAADGVPIVGLNYKDDSREKAVRWLNTLGDPYQLNLFDAKGTVALEFGVYGAPETFLIDAQGRIRYRHVGDVNERVWQGELGQRYRALAAEGEN
ncbi:Thiol:disulfide interchange protein DsbE [Pseudidiomarina piscicola]|uniref:Thiol:disulfide interchange protein DsbE n=1 Tax=Pseudidiomarina piscicola TaxID=2614830 RepID=A0A6S6WSZ2_9GAMM|nr:DsbE family thiol:disulfide interchange protein [Pseudidiomarina piscicola]CAB0149453.1 Thiol:disulfide interchange protein DsbE [Pseudidiomarina piscicola]VZT38895.1 Thiol:disulfide interchange protein DsbE [Pseudomonas aeruginosa]